MFFKERVDAEVKRKATDTAPEAVRAVSARVAPEVAATIERFGQKLADFVSASNEDTRRTMIEVLSTTRWQLIAAKDGEAPNVGEVDALVTQQRALKERVERLRAQVWEQAVEGIAGIPMAVA
jgi:hypothetical protein